MLKNSGPWRRGPLKGWIKSLESMERLPPVYDVLLAEVLEQQGYRPDYKPASLVHLDQLFNALENFSPEHNTRIDIEDPTVAEGMKMAWKVFAKPANVERIKPLRLIDTEPHIKKSKSAGLTMLHHTKGEAMEYAMGRAGQILNGVKSPNPCLAGIRSQAKDPETGRIEDYVGKTRLVWAYPAEMTLIEAKFAVPLYEIFKRKRTTMMFGRSKMDVGCLIDSAVKNTGDCVYGLDYSKFDSTIPAYLIRYAFKILRTWFDFSGEDQSAWDTVIKYFIHTPIVMPDGNLYTGKKHGVPSGSYFTQLIDSIVNTVLIGALSKNFNLSVSWRHFFVLGDDVILSTYKGLDLHQVADYLKDTFGIILHPTKCEVHKAHFLGADWPVVTPVRDIQELVNKAVWPERYRSYNGDTRAEKVDDAQQVLLSYSKSYYNAWNLVMKRFRMANVYNDGTVAYWHQGQQDAHLTGYERYKQESEGRERMSSYTLQCLS